MHYTNFYIKNYKGIKDLTIDLEREPSTNIITLVGLNESGKTTILEAISTLENEPNENDRHKLIPKSKKFNFSDTIEIHATLKTDRNDEREIRAKCQEIGLTQSSPIGTFKMILKYIFKDSVYQPEESGWGFEFSLNGKKAGQRQERLYFPSSLEYESIEEFIKHELIPPIIYYPNFLFDFPPRIYLEESTSEDKEQKTYRSVLKDIMDTIGDGINIDDHIVNRIKNPSDGSDEALEATIERVSSQITKIVFDAWSQLFDGSGKEIKLKPGLDTSNGLVYLEVKLKEGTEQFQISERSLGFKWFFTFLLFTEFRKNRGSEKGQILFLLDEPASNLHSTAQKNLLKTFERLVDSCKMIYTTHSHHLINPTWLSGAYIVVNKAINYEDGALNSVLEKTDVDATIYKQFVLNHPDQRTYFQPILDAIEYMPSLLEEVPNIVVLEGKFDYYTFKYINEILLNSEFELNFYPGNSADRNSHTIALYLAWGRDFLILLDGDKAGEDAKKRYFKEFGTVLTGKLMTLKDIDPTFNIALEEFFEPEELLGITKTFDNDASSYNKSKFNTAIQNLYIQEQSYPLSEVTINKFRKVFEVLTT